MRFPRFNQKLAVVVALLATLFAAESAHARVRLENICTIYGQKETRLTGLGLVVGLQGTGDGGKNATAMRSLASFLRLMNSPATIRELKDANNVAVVLVEATVPATGLRRGQKIDCHVSSIMGAKSLRGGRLLSTPLETVDLSDETAVALAGGALEIEDPDSLTVARIPSGVMLEQDFLTFFVDRQHGNIMKLLLDESHASFHTAREVAHVINSDFSYESQNQNIARAVNAGTIEVKVPDAYLNFPVEFAAQVLDVAIDNPQTQARVVVNSRTKTVIVDGDVEIDQTLIHHPNLTVQVGESAGGNPEAAGRFVPVPRLNNEQGSAPQQLEQLVQAMNELKVPSEDIIAIIRELHNSGALHATYIEH